MEGESAKTNPLCVFVKGLKVWRKNARMHLAADLRQSRESANCRKVTAECFGIRGCRCQRKQMNHRCL